MLAGSLERRAKGEGSRFSRNFAISKRDLVKVTQFHGTALKGTKKAKIQIFKFGYRYNEVHCITIIRPINYYYVPVRSRGQRDSRVARRSTEGEIDDQRNKEKQKRRER